jgi:phosphoribosylanthranilate isomerase
MRTRIKICGCTSIADIEGAVEAGADAVGVILATSPRKVTLANARALVRSVPAFVSVVGVMVNPDETFVDDVLALGMVPQFSGDESPEFCATWANGRYVKVIHLTSGVDYSAADIEAATARYPDADLQFDSRAGALYGGTGTAFSWPLVEAIARRRRIIVSGGLLPENVAAAVAGVRPFGVDVRSGVESGDKKDTVKMRAFVRAVRETDEGHSLAKT